MGALVISTRRITGRGGAEYGDSQPIAGGVDSVTGKFFRSPGAASRIVPGYP